MADWTLNDSFPLSFGMEFVAVAPAALSATPSVRPMIDGTPSTVPSLSGSPEIESSVKATKIRIRGE